MHLTQSEFIQGREESGEGEGFPVSDHGCPPSATNSAGADSRPPLLVTRGAAINGAVGSLARNRQRGLHDDAVAGIIRGWHLHDGIRRIADTGGAWVVKLISFDIDGTLEVGDPPGIITMDMVRAIKALGYVIGSGSDRTLSSQRHLWESHRMVVDFTVLKHQLAAVKAQFQAEAYYHIGDTDMDRVLANRAGFRFVRVDAALRQAWGPEMFP